MDTTQAAIVSTQEGKEKYDAVLKQLIADRRILARILKSYVPEFADCSIRDIEEKYIFSDTITVSKTGVQKNMTNLVESTGIEDKSNNEGNITYDIMFRAGYPGKQGGTIGLYINLEIQNSYYPGYPLESRGVYYAARRLSSELTKIDNHTNYGELQKVYSIWLCVGDDVPDKKAGTVSLYEMNKRDIIGTVDVPKEYYDLISVIMIRINDQMKSEDGTLKLLQALCSKNAGKKKKLEELKKSGIYADQPLEGGIDRVCNLSESIYQDGVNVGIEQGMEIGTKKTGIGTVCRMLAEGLPISSIAKFTNIGEDTVKKIDRVADGNISCDNDNIDRIFKEMYPDTAQ